MLPQGQRYYSGHNKRNNRDGNANNRSSTTSNNENQPQPQQNNTRRSVSSSSNKYNNNRGKSVVSNDNGNNYNSIQVQSINYFGLEEKGSGKDLLNMFPIQLQPTTSIYQYHVDISPKVDNKYLSYRIVKQVMDPSINYLQSGSIIYSITALAPPLQQEKLLLKTCVYNQVVYSININFATTITVSNCGKDFMTFVNVVLKTAQSKLQLTRIGRNSYNEKNATTLHDYGLRILGGTMSTTWLTSKGLVLLVDMIYKSMRTETVLTQIREIQDKFSSKDVQLKVSQALRNTIVYLTYRKKTIHIEDVDFQKSPLSTFPYQGREISFVAYYQQQYGIEGIDTNQPMLKHTNRKSGNVEYFIPSLCLLTGISQDMRNNYNTMVSIKNVTKKPPTQRIRETLQHQLDAINNQDFTEELQKWGISIVPKMIEVQTTHLKQSPITMGGDVEIVADDIAMFKVENKKMYSICKPLENVLVLCPGTKEGKDLLHFCEELKKACSEVGIDVTKLKFVFEPYNSRNINETSMEQTITKVQNLSFILMVTKSKTGKEYDLLKRKTIADLGIPSQCIVEKNTTTSNKLPSILRNIAIELNCKLGGIPWTTQVPMKKNTMLIGMDVNHSGEVYIRTKSSIVGFVSTYSSNACEYYSQIQVQAPGVEMVKGLKELVEKSIQNFKQERKALPEHIIFFRDGVGSGQEDHIFNEEILAVQQVCKKHSILLNFVLVLKRINNRLYHGLDSNGQQFGNPNPGTVLNGDILSGDSNEMSFLLQSHHVSNKQGTSTPTRYKILLTESNFGLTYFQNITFKLCHLYYNRCGISSVPAPCMYAHRVAFMHGQSNIDRGAKENLAKTLYHL